MNTQDSSYKHVFICSCPRSGNTLLQFMLTAHPDVCISPETNSIAKLVSRFPLDTPLTSAQLEQAKTFIINDPKLNNWAMGTEKLHKQLEGITEGSIQDLLDAILLYYKEETCPEATYIGNKKNMLERAEMLKKVYPDAKILILVRDARAVVSSMLSKLVGWDTVQAAITWLWCIRRGQQIQRRFPDDVLQVSYERLVSHPEEEAKSICSFLGIEFSPEMMEYYKNFDREFAHKGEGSKRAHANISKPVTADRIDSWKEELAEADLFVTEAIAGKQLASLGYKLHTNASGGFSHYKYLPKILKNQFLLWARWMKEWYILTR